MSYRKYIKTAFLISNMHGQELNLDNFKGDFLIQKKVKKIHLRFQIFN